MAYLRKHAGAGRPDYGAMRRRGLPIGSGGIESTVRRVVNLRLKGNGQVRLREGAEGTILLRAAALAGGWDEAVGQAQRCEDANGRPGWTWPSPDRPLQLKAKEAVKPPAPQASAA